MLFGATARHVRACAHVKLQGERMNVHLGVFWQILAPPFHSSTRRSDRTPIVGTRCPMNPSTSACMHNHCLSHLRCRFCQAPREKNRYFSTASRIQDGRLHVGREDSPFHPALLLREPLPTSSLSVHDARTHAHTSTRATNIFFSHVSIFATFDIFLCVAMPVGFSFFFFFTVDSN